MEFYLDEKGRRKRRRILKLKIYGSLAIFLLLVGGAAYSVVYTPVFKVKNIKFETTSAGVPEFFTAQAIESAANFKNDDVLNEKLISDFKSFFIKHSKINSFLGGDNIFVWDEKLIPDDFLLKNYPQLADVKIEKDYIERSVKISLTKREKLGVWCKMDKIQESAATSTASSTVSNEVASPDCFWFDKEGVTFAQAPAAEGNLIYKVNDFSGRPLQSGNNVLEKKFLTNLIKIFEVLEKANLKVRSLRLENLALQEIIVEPVTDFSPKIYFSLKADPIFGLSTLTSFKNIDLVKIDYIDLRVPNRAYYKLK